MVIQSIVLLDQDLMDRKQISDYIVISEMTTVKLLIKTIMMIVNGERLDLCNGPIFPPLKILYGFHFVHSYLVYLTTLPIVQIISHRLIG
jgi:hypothetical protein